MPASSNLTAHITGETTIMPAVAAYEVFLNDQGRSHYTVKAFLSDLRLMATRFPADQSVGSSNTTD